MRTRSLKDMARMETFSNTLKTEQTDSPTHPFRLYELLSQAARLYLDSKSHSLITTPTDSGLWSLHKDGFSEDTITLAEGSTYQDGLATDLGNWYNGNQQLMSLLDEDMMF